MEQTHLYYQESMYVVNQLLLYYRQNIWSKALDRMQSSQLTTGQRNLNKNKISSYCYVAVQLFLLRAQIFSARAKIMNAIRRIFITEFGGKIFWFYFWDGKVIKYFIGYE